MYQPIDRFIKTVFQIETDLNLAGTILSQGADKLNSAHPQERDIYSSIFVTNDIPLDGSYGLLNTYMGEWKYIKTNELGSINENYLKWSSNMAIVRIYNALETLLYEVIYTEDLCKVFDQTNIKVITKEVQTYISNYLESNGLGKRDYKNNRHLIKFLASKNDKCSKFFSQEIRKGHPKTYRDFFEFIGVFRNIVVHNGMLVGEGTLNQLKGLDHNLLNKYFQCEELSRGTLFISVSALNFVNLSRILSDFALNSVKFIKGEEDLSFANFKLSGE